MGEQERGQAGDEQVARQHQEDIAGERQSEGGHQPRPLGLR